MNIEVLIRYHTVKNIMTKDEFITLIKLTKGITKMNQVCKMLTGTGMDDGLGNDIHLLWDLFRENSSEQFKTNTKVGSLCPEHYLCTFKNKTIANP